MPVERLDIDQAGGSDILVNEHWLRYKFIREHLTTEKVLDIACGSAYGSYYLSLKESLNITGADVDARAISKAKEKYQKDNLDFQVANALSLPFNDNSFDVVVSLETIEHFNAYDQKLYLQELKRVLKKNGKLWLSTPNKEASKHKNPWHLKELNFNELKSIIADNFLNYRILKQGTALATIIENSASKDNDVNNNVNNDNVNNDTNNNIEMSSELFPKYFIVVASNSKENINLKSSSVSLNPQAFNRLDNHLAKKISDKIYYPLSKILKKIRGKKKF